jgi:hypothetical protein
VEVLGPDSYKLQGGINPLDSFTSVEANDTLIHVNETGSYESLEVSSFLEDLPHQISLPILLLLRSGHSGPVKTLKSIAWPS